MDFYPIGSVWGMDTSSMWVAAAAAGTPTKISPCYFKIVHSNGWETNYYHLENIQNYAGSINQNDKIGVIANTLAEATCSGGAASGPHVHFTLKHNGALVAINGTPLSGWYVHTGRWNYDTSPSYMWLERAGQKKYAYSDTVLSEGSTTFADVPMSYWAWESIDILAKNAITSGCSDSPKMFCPGAVVTRDQMAVFLIRAKHGAAYVPPAPVGVFVDVPKTYWAAAWIEQLAAEGITGGCSTTPKLYCPGAAVLRDQMAVFLIRAEHGSAYALPAPTGIFADVPITFWAAAWIEQLAGEGITGGCSSTPKQYCPAMLVTRDQMAVFLVRAFGLK